MNHNLSTLFTIASAPVVDLDAPLQVRITAKAMQTLRAHHAPVPRLRRCLRVAATSALATEDAEPSPYDATYSED